MFSGADVAAILRQRGWLEADEDAAHVPPPGEARGQEIDIWLERAALLLGPHAADREALGRLLDRVFRYDACTLLRESANQAVLAQAGAREVIRALANKILEGGEVDSEGFKRIIEALKNALPYRGPALFFPIRMALAGGVGDGALDRVILLLDSAAKLPFRAPVKSARQRILEFCAALD